MSDPVYNVQIELLCYYNINYQFSFSLQRIGPIWRQSMISKDSVYIILCYIMLYIISYYIIIIFRDSPVHAVWHLGRTVTVTSTGLDSRPVISIMSPSPNTYTGLFNLNANTVVPIRLAWFFSPLPIWPYQKGTSVVGFLVSKFCSFNNNLKDHLCVDVTPINNK